MDHKLCMIPGPIEISPLVQTAMSTPATSHLDPHFMKTFSETLKLTRKAFLAPKDSQPFIVAGSGTLTWDMTAANLLERSDKVLVVNTGIFGDWFAECITVYGGVVTQVKFNEFGDSPSLDAIERELQAAVKSGAPFKLITITHVDTSTSVLADVEGISKLVHRISPSTLIAIDGVCSIGAEEMRMADWGIDVAMTASQKALGVPPGLGVMVVSKRAMDVANSRSTPPTTYFGSFIKWAPIMQKYEALQPCYFATPPVQLIFALHASLVEFVQDMEGRFTKHASVSDAFKAKITLLGLKIVPVSLDKAAHSLTAIYYPPGVSGSDLIPKITAKGVVVAGGLYPGENTKYFRVGHMGLSAVGNDGHVETTVDAIAASLRDLGCGFK